MDAPWVGGLAAILAAMVAATLIWEPHDRLTAWVAYLLLMLLFIAVAGQGITHRWDGLLIDRYNRMSLARLQLTLWTVLILATLLAIALASTLAGTANPLAIAIPEQIWVVMGISTTSLVSAPILQARKADAKLIAYKAGFEEASWQDLFRGDETGNFPYLDLAKIQMFFFTVVLVVVYGVGIAHLLAGSAAVTALPEMDSSMIALLGISHAGYLANKAVPRPAEPAATPR